MLSLFSRTLSEQSQKDPVPDPGTIILSMPPTENIVCGKAHPIKLRRQRNIPVHSEKDMVYEGRSVFELCNNLRIAAENEIQIPFLKFLLKIDSAVLAKLYPDSGNAANIGANI